MSDIIIYNNKPYFKLYKLNNLIINIINSSLLNKIPLPKDDFQEIKALFSYLMSMKYTDTKHLIEFFLILNKVLCLYETYILTFLKEYPMYENIKESDCLEKAENLYRNICDMNYNSFMKGKNKVELNEYLYKIKEKHRKDSEYSQDSQYNTKSLEYNIKRDEYIDEYFSLKRKLKLIKIYVFIIFGVIILVLLYLIHRQKA